MTKVMPALVFASAIAAACGTVSESVKVATFSTRKVLNATVDPRLVDEHCPFGAPRKLPSLEHGPTQLVGRAGYVLEHDGAAKIPLWVCESLAPRFLAGPAERRDRFLPDPALPETHRAAKADYRHSGYQRGHMVASEDRVATQALNDETFYLSNMVPQSGPLNGGMWARLEALARAWASNGTVTDARAITGGFFYDPAEDDPATADGLIAVKQIGKGKVAVPTHIFKLVAGHDRNNRWRAIAFVVPNEKPRDGWRFEDFIVAIDWLEERAGLDVMPDLDPADEQALEAKPSPMWR